MFVHICKKWNKDDKKAKKVEWTPGSVMIFVFTRFGDVWVLFSFIFENDEVTHCYKVKAKQIYMESLVHKNVSVFLVYCLVLDVFTIVSNYYL